MGGALSGAIAVSAIVLFGAKPTIREMRELGSPPPTTPAPPPEPMEARLGEKLHGLTATALSGRTVDFSTYAGKPLLMVNVASC